MFILLVYDIGEKRVIKALKICRQYLDWVQNSVFEGELTKAGLETLKKRLGKIMNKEEDSVRIYKLRSEDYLTIEILGIDKKQVADDGIL
ncbi:MULTISPECIES: CRISPR-associated endonuclease Cas2 [unclassified Mesotoga]|uniref:CRISPR-associated endonuclease Cas2 n=1 Tax=unclassified Mesotoga TaxID=1184398 RepID=UPI000DA6C642|nr:MULTISPECIES: CRISPR-associated endonuclease Cas2 [unclassified Mesotoga]PZC51854.1 CRISPR-associated protein Cas2 [Mesotoga sp. TolDC]